MTKVTTLWLSSPAKTESKNLMVAEVSLPPGSGHSFHKHREQEEVIYVIEGTVEQWLGEKKLMLSPGDSVFIPADEVHASFNSTDSPAKALAIVGPCVGPEGYQASDVDDEAPWNALR